MGRGKGSGPGRPTDLTPDVHDKLIAAIQAGNYIETAAAFAGVNQCTVRDWVRRGVRELRRVSKSRRAKIKKREQPFVDFSEAVKRAQATAEVADVNTIRKASEQQWQAAAWRLERKFPEKWGRRERLEHTGKRGGPIKHKVDDERAAARAVFEDPEAFAAAEIVARKILERGEGERTDSDD